MNQNLFSLQPSKVEGLSHGVQSAPAGGSVQGVWSVYRECSDPRLKVVLSVGECR